MAEQLIDYDGAIICSFEHQNTNQFCKWPDVHLTWTITGGLPGINLSALKDAYSEAWSYWSDVCGIEPTYTQNARTASILMGSGHIDGPSGTLAWSQLPCGRVSQLQQRYDTGDLWVIAENPPRGKIDLVRVAAHELGHALGLFHLQSGALLQPSYSVSIRRPTEIDKAEIRRRYGPRRSRPVPQPTPTPNGGSMDKTQELLLYGLGFLEGIATKTATPFDDALVGGMKYAVSNPTLWALLVDLFGKLGRNEITTEQVATALTQATSATA